MEKENHSIQDTLIAFYESVRDTRDHKMVRLEDALEQVKSYYYFKSLIDSIKKEDSEEIKKERKNSLPIFCFSIGSISENRIDVNVEEHSGIIAIDIDKLKEYNTDPEDLKKRLSKDDYVLSCFSSVSGNIKLLVKIPPCDKDLNILYYHDLSKYFQEKYFLKRDQFDRSCQNISRAQFISYDPNIYINYNSTLYLNEDLKVDYLSIKKNPKKSITGGNRNGNNIIGSSDTFFDLYNHPNINFDLMDIARDKETYNYHTTIKEDYFVDPNEPLIVKEGLLAGDMHWNWHNKFKEGNRNRVMGAISMILIYNNLGKSFEQLLDHFKYINSKTCLPPLSNTEVYNIMAYNYDQLLKGDLQFEKVLNKKHVFWSKDCTLNKDQKREIANKEYAILRKENTRFKLDSTMPQLTDGLHKLTQKRLAAYSGVSEPTVKRYWSVYKDNAREYNQDVKLTLKEVVKELNKHEITEPDGDLIWTLVEIYSPEELYANDPLVDYTDFIKELSALMLHYPAKII